MDDAARDQARRILGPPDVAIECGVHPDGPEDHVERHLALRRAGWRVHDVLPSSADRRGERVVELLDALRAEGRRADRS